MSLHTQKKNKHFKASALSTILVCSSVFLSACGGSSSDNFDSEVDDEIVVASEEGIIVEAGQVLDVAAAAEIVEPDITAETDGMQMLAASGFESIGDEDDIFLVDDTGDLLPMIFDSSTNVDPAFALSGAGLVERLNDSLALPADINVRFADCGEANAFFAPPIGNEGFAEVAEGGAIFICHELTDLFSGFFADTEQAFAASTFVIMHELGHALVNQLNLPVLGIEESYVDGVAAVLLGESGMAEGAVLAGWFFASQGQAPFFDTHRAGPQRLGDLACWGIGAEPELLEDPGIASIAEQLILTGRRCTVEYNQQLSGLENVLGGHIRGGLTDLIATEFDISEFVPTDTDTIEVASEGG